MRYLANLFLVIFLTFLISSQSFSSDAPVLLEGFNGSKFRLSDNSQRNGFLITEDPIDKTNTKKVFKFTIKPAPCLKADCDYQNVRASVEQSPNSVQPREAWYGWEMYFPKDFPIGTSQSKGFQQFNEWKDQLQCGLASTALDLNSEDRYLSWVMKKFSDDDCKVVHKYKLIDMVSIMGNWHRFELYALWSKGSDGRFDLYLDGVQILNHKGPTCFADCKKMNYHLIGNYLCCTPDTKKIVEATVYYRFMSRANSREKLVWN